MKWTVTVRHEDEMERKMRRICTEQIPFREV
jgi:hypothetical protein